MIALSKLAASVLLETLRASGVLPERGLRLKNEDGRYTLELDAPREDDRVIRHEGEVVLIVCRSMESEIGDARIDVEENADGRNLVMRRSG